MNIRVKQVLLILCLSGLVTAIHADTLKKVAADLSYDPDARINLKPRTEQVQPDDGRELGDILMTIDLAAIGMPGDGYDNAGLTWDSQYLYLVNMFDNLCYVIDPTGPSIQNTFLAASGLSWGLGHEQSLWMTEYYTLTAYEYTYAGSPTGNSFYCLQGGASWMGDCSEWWQDGEIWILAVGGTNAAYKFALPSGALLGSISDPTWTYISQRGLTYDPWEDRFWVGGWNSDTVWEIYSDGIPTGRQFGFNSVASLAYDWQSTIYPMPVLWLATNDAVNTLYMVDIYYGFPPPDVGCTEVVSPVGGVMPGEHPVIGRVQNFGLLWETFNATAVVWDTITMTIIFTQTITIVDLAPGTDSLFDFGTVYLGQSGYTEIWTELAGDTNPDNDTASAYYFTLDYDLTWDFEDGWQGWTHTNGLPFPDGWAPFNSMLHGDTWCIPDAGSSSMWIDDDAAA